MVEIIYVCVINVILCVYVYILLLIFNKVRDFE